MLLLNVDYVKKNSICKHREVLKAEEHNSELFHLLGHVPVLTYVDLLTLPSVHTS